MQKVNKISSKINRILTTNLIKLGQEAIKIGPKIDQNRDLEGSWGVLGPSWPQDGLKSKKNIEK